MEEVYKEQTFSDCCTGCGKTKQDAVMEANVCVYECTRVCTNMWFTLNRARFLQGTKLEAVNPRIRKSASFEKGTCSRSDVSVCAEAQKKERALQIAGNETWPKRLESAVCQVGWWVLETQWKIRHNSPPGTDSGMGQKLRCKLTTNAWTSPCCFVFGV